MSIFTRATPAEPSAHREPQHLELWVPPELADVFADVEPRVAATVSPLTSPAWFDELTGANLLDLAVGAAASPAERAIRLSPIRGHVEVALAVTEYDGVVPGTVLPTSFRVESVAVPYDRGGGDVSSILHKWEQVVPSQEARERFQRSERDREPFRARVEQIVREVLSDHERAWAAYVHIKTLEAAAKERDARADRERRDRDRRAMLECPLCHELNGSIAVRPLVHDARPPARFVKGPHVRSCRECWREAATQYGVRRSLDTLEDGRTRAEHISDWLDANVSGIELREPDRAVAERA